MSTQLGCLLLFAGTLLIVEVFEHFEIVGLFMYIFICIFGAVIGWNMKIGDGSDL